MHVIYYKYFLIKNVTMLDIHVNNIKNMSIYNILEKRLIFIIIRNEKNSLYLLLVI